MKNLAAFIAMGVVLGTASISLASEEVTWTKGEIKKVDLEQGKITVKHEEMKDLDMPSMTMVFTTKDPAMLRNVAPGQTAEFEFVEENGRIIVKQIRQ